MPLTTNGVSYTGLKLEGDQLLLNFAYKKEEYSQRDGTYQSTVTFSMTIENWVALQAAVAQSSDKLQASLSNSLRMLQEDRGR